MTDNVIRIQDYERKNKQPDAAGPRNPADADVVILSARHVKRIASDAPSEPLPDNTFVS